MRGGILRGRGGRCLKPLEDAITARLTRNEDDAGKRSTGGLDSFLKIIE